MNKKHYRIKSTEIMTGDKGFTFDTYLSDDYATRKDAVEELKHIWEHFGIRSNPNFIVNGDSIEFNIECGEYIGSIQFAGNEILFKATLGTLEYSKTIYIEEVLVA